MEFAFNLGELGTQYVLKSKKAFDNIKFVDAVPAEKNVYYSKFYLRDSNARKLYKNISDISDEYETKMYLSDIIKEGSKNGKL